MIDIPPSAGPSRGTADSAPATGGETRSPRKPLAPVHPVEPVGADADPGQDVAPNLGGEEQMQDA